MHCGVVTKDYITLNNNLVVRALAARNKVIHFTTSDQRFILE